MNLDLALLFVIQKSIEHIRNLLVMALEFFHEPCEQPLTVPICFVHELRCDVGQPFIQCSREECNLHESRFAVSDIFEQCAFASTQGHQLILDGGEFNRYTLTLFSQCSD